MTRPDLDTSLSPEGAGARPIHPRERLERWLESTPGRYLAAVEASLMTEVLPNLFGYYAVQVGHLGDVDLLGSSRILHRLMVTPDGRGGPGGYPVARGMPTALPVESDGVDLVLLPHVLEFESDPHDALREAARVLVPEGHLVVCGFNPWSLLGLWRGLRRRGSPVGADGQMLGANRLRDWLKILGFELRTQSVYCFRPPLHGPTLMRRLEFLERMGPRIVPPLGGAYLILARKRVSTMTPIRPRWRFRRRLSAVGLPGPSVGSS
jgi:SAM-dependent methyltransferase